MDQENELKKKLSTSSSSNNSSNPMITTSSYNPSAKSNINNNEWKMTSSNNMNTMHSRTLLAQPSKGRDSPRLGSRNMPLDGHAYNTQPSLDSLTPLSRPSPFEINDSSTNIHTERRNSGMSIDLNNDNDIPPPEYVDVKLGFPEEKFLVLINPGKYSIQYKVPRNAPFYFTSPYACPFNVFAVRQRINISIEVNKMGPRSVNIYDKVFVKKHPVQQTIDKIKTKFTRRNSSSSIMEASANDTNSPILKVNQSLRMSSLTHIHEFNLTEKDLPALVSIKFSTRALFTTFRVSAVITKLPSENHDPNVQKSPKNMPNLTNKIESDFEPIVPSDRSNGNDLQIKEGSFAAAVAAPPPLQRQNSILLLDVLEMHHQLQKQVSSSTLDIGDQTLVDIGAAVSKTQQPKIDEKPKESYQGIEVVPNLHMRLLKTFGSYFVEVDEKSSHADEGRVVMLRGVNLAGNTKLPRGCNTQDVVDWSKYLDKANARDGISFVGRPFPLEDARDHFARISRWGFNCIRFIVTWEAIEHVGPGEYDVEYLDYVEQVIKIAGEYGLYVFIDPHQDVWCRATGGDGAPLWTLQAAGLDVRYLEECGAAFTHQSHKDPTQFPRMTWPQNYQRFACLHMFTLFWGGNDFAPEFFVGDGDNSVPIQEYLQSHFINSMMQVCMRVAKYPHVIGFDSFNEPSAGFICQSLDRIPETVIPPGLVFTPFDAMATAAGFTREVRHANQFGVIINRRPVNERRISCWQRGKVDIWRYCGIYDVINGEPCLLKPDYFKRSPHSGVEVNFFRDFLRPFMVRYATKIRSVMPRAILFIEGDAFGEKDICWDKNFDGGQVVNATHWYDGFTLFTRSFNPHFSINTRTMQPLFGSKAIKDMHLEDLREIQNNPHGLDGRQTIMPTLIGEFGIPYDMNNKRAFKNGNYRNHELALSTYYDIFDELFLSSTQWNYSVENSNMFGDNWNLEDLSIYSPKNNYDKDGGRAIKGFSRPYPKFTCGAPAQLKFNFATKTFLYKYIPDPLNFLMGKQRAAHAGNQGTDHHHSDSDKDDFLWHSTVIYIPNIQYENKSFKIKVVRGTFELVPHDGYHHLHVWADVSAQPRQVLEAVEVYIHAKHDQ